MAGSVVAEFDHIWPAEPGSLNHLPCVRCGAPYGPNAGMCQVVVQIPPDYDRLRSYLGHRGGS